MRGLGTGMVNVERLSVCMLVHTTPFCVDLDLRPLQTGAKMARWTTAAIQLGRCTGYWWCSLQWAHGQKY